MDDAQEGYTILSEFVGVFFLQAVLFSDAEAWCASATYHIFSFFLLFLPSSASAYYKLWSIYYSFIYFCLFCNFPAAMFFLKEILE